jgi:mannose-6-phosphate isomerase-like protein (cupin superfamily)
MHRDGELQTNAPVARSVPVGRVRHSREFVDFLCSNTMTDRISLVAKFATISDHWNPRIAAELNGQHVKLVKLQGAFDWHSHEHEDELFFVHRGAFTMEFRDRSVVLSAGDILVVPRGVEHRPVAEHECEVMLFEPASTLNTGDAVSERTRTVLERI